MMTSHAAETSAGATGIIFGIVVSAATVVQRAVEVPPITWETQVLAAVIGAFGGVLFVRVSSGIEDWVDAALAIMLAAISGGMLGPAAALAARARFPGMGLETLPAGGVVPCSFILGAIVPMAFGLLVAGLQSLKQNPSGAINFIVVSFRSLRGKNGK